MRLQLVGRVVTVKIELAAGTLPNLLCSIYEFTNKHTHKHTLTFTGGMQLVVVTLIK